MMTVDRLSCLARLFYGDVCWLWRWRSHGTDLNQPHPTTMQRTTRLARLWVISVVVRSMLNTTLHDADDDGDGDGGNPPPPVGEVFYPADVCGATRRPIDTTAATNTRGSNQSTRCFGLFAASTFVLFVGFLFWFRLSAYAMCSAEFSTPTPNQAKLNNTRNRRTPPTIQHTRTDRHVREGGRLIVPRDLLLPCDDDDEFTFLPLLPLFRLKFQKF